MVDFYDKNKAFYVQFSPNRADNQSYLIFVAIVNIFNFQPLMH